MKVAVIILNYKNVTETLSCLSSIEHTTQCTHEIYLVDNASGDHSKEVLQQQVKKHKHYHFIEAKTNGGYAKGNNLGLKKALQDGCSHFIILNNDTLVYDHLFTSLIDYLKQHEHVGIVGPGICTYENTDLLESAGSLVNLNNGKIKRLYTGQSKETIKGKVISCDYVGGACMAFSKTLLQDIGFIPETYFLFFEENEWCLTAKKRGYDVCCLGDALLIHKGSATINQFSGLSEYYTYRNLVLFIKRNGTCKNKLYFYPYILLFALKAGLTKHNGWRFMRYVRDGFFNKETYRKEKL